MDYTWSKLGSMEAGKSALPHHLTWMFLCSQPLTTVLSTQYISFNLTVILMSEEAFSELHFSQEPAGHLSSCHGEPTGYAALAARSSSRQ
jgi:hypothetical protein